MLLEIMSYQKFFQTTIIFKKSKWELLEKKEWFKELVLTQITALGQKLPVGEQFFYELIKEELAQNYPKMKILNNESVIYDEYGYIGLTHTQWPFQRER
ncbi:hypothetical protein ICE98_02600 [Lactococcus lactis]|nr:hypothetical protein [Lactococcus lactis]